METSRRAFMLAAASATLAAGGSGASAADGGKGLRLLTFERKDAAGPRIGVLVGDDKVIDLAAAKTAGAALAFDPADMISLIAAGAPALAQVRDIAAKPTATLALSEIRHHSPIPVPQRNIYAVGWNYLAHFNESATAQAAHQSYPEHPVFFTKGTHCMNGPFDPIPFDPKVSTLIDWEGELAVIIGRKGRNISEADAMNYVFGYSVINDTTARDVQSKKHGGQWFKGKSLDGHGPMGPWIVTADALDPDKLRLQTRVNGVVKQDAMTTQMYFKIPRIIAELSLGLTLEAGDIIATGTPPGVGNSRKPPEYLKPGDVMETEIEGIGVIRNTITQVA